MRTFGACASILAVCNIVVVTSPAFAQDSAAPEPAKSDTAKSDTAKPDDAKKDTTAGAAGDDAKVDVHVESPVPVSLERRAPGSQTWENVCTTPCDVKTSRVAEYRIVGDGLNESKPFMIDGTKDKVVLSVNPGSTGRASAGLYVLVGGALITIAGLGVMFLGADRHGVFQADGLTHNGHLNAMFFGGALVMTGVATGLFGAGWMIGNKHTGVGGDVSKVIDEKAAPGGGGGNGPGGGGGVDVKFSTSSRQPTWNTQKNVGLPQVYSVPVLSGKF